MIDTINQLLREGQTYSAQMVAKQCGISSTHAAACLRTLLRGGIVEREKLPVGFTKDGKEKRIFFYKTKQKDLAI